MKSIDELNETASVESDTASTPPVSSATGRRSTLGVEKTTASDKLLPSEGHVIKNGISTHDKVSITIQGDVSEAADSDTLGWA